MNRFVYQKQKNPIFQTLPFIFVFLAVVLLFFQSISSISSGTRKRQKESLENAITRSVTYCYAVEGAYPASLDYLKDNYGLIYDESLFSVDYKAAGANVLPDFTITEREE